MKFLFIRTLMLFLFSTGTIMANEFCDGFEKGYETGHKQASGSSFDPFTPFCPFKPFKGFNDPDSNFEFGYTIGYREGMSAGQRS